VLAFNLLGDGLCDALGPKIEQREKTGFALDSAPALAACSAALASGTRRSG
jgi:hypothetical protein